MARQTSDLQGRVQAAHQFDEGALLRYVRANVEGFPSKLLKFTVTQFGHGQSNPTFLLEAVAEGRSGTLVNRYVLRKKPPVLKALGAHTDVPVPNVFCLCPDPSIIGTPFYIMEYLEGRIFLDSSLPGLAPETRRAVYEATAKTLAALHMVNVDSIGLGKLGRRENYCKRQVERWERQYLLSTGEEKPVRNPRMQDLAGWLKQHIPLEDYSASAGTGLVHGDFRIDNLVFHPTEYEVIGVIDWELSTLGNQMCDVAYSTLHFIMDITLSAESRGGLQTEGIPLQAEYLADYCKAAGRPWPVENWKFYIAFSLFRIAAIYAGVYHRWTMGNASGGERAQHTGKQANRFIDIALEFIRLPHVLPDQPPSAGASYIIVGIRMSPLSITMNLSKRYGVKIDMFLEGFKIIFMKRAEVNLHPKEVEILFPPKKVLELRDKLLLFMEKHIYPMESEFYQLAQSNRRWTIHPEEERLKELAKKKGFGIYGSLTVRARKLLLDNTLKTAARNERLLGAGLSNLEYGYICEIMGRSVWAPQIFNCGPPDTGNMEVLLRYGNKEQQKEWLVPLLEGNIRSGFAMTEPRVASSDATNIECSIRREGNFYVINGTKWWTSGAMDPRCRLLIVMGKTDFNAPRHKQQSMILVDAEAPGVLIRRPLLVFGFDDAPHGHAEISFDNVRVPVENILLGEGRGFEIAQGRLGPGRLHHCMRLVGAAERGMQLMVQRALGRRVFGKTIAEQGSFLSDLAKCRVELEATRLLVLEAADQLDRLGNKKARGTIAMAKVSAPNMALRVLDMAMQVHGAAGLSSDTVLSHLWATARSLRIADGPDEVHLGTIAKLELQRAKL